MTLYNYYRISRLTGWKMDRNQVGPEGDVDEMNIVKNGANAESHRLKQNVPADNHRVMNYGPGGFLGEHVDPGLGSVLSFLG